MMFKKALLLFSLLILLTGCVERGYKLTVNEVTNTITAVKSIDIRKENKATIAKDIDKMSRAVSKAQKIQIKNTTTKKSIPITKVQPLKKENTKKAIQKETLAEQKRIAQKKEMEQRQAALNAKLAKEKEAQKLAAQKERMRLQEEAEAKKIAQEEKEKALEAIKEEKQRKAAAQKLAMEKAAQEKREQEEKAALEYKITKEKAIRVKKEKEQRDALALKIAKEKQIAFEKQKAEMKRKRAEEKKAAADKLRLEREAAIRKAKAEENKVVKTAERLNFKPSTQTYQKFGTSEIHGHVVYLTPSGQEISLNNTKIYLVPKNTKTDYWYNNYYLKNKESASISRSTVHYINATHLNVENNFAFYGLAKGTYYVIIESSYPSSIAKDKKVYIAKKINVEKYKKIMTVFSKRL